MVSENGVWLDGTSTEEPPISVDASSREPEAARARKASTSFASIHSLRRTCVADLPKLLKRSGQSPQNEILRGWFLSPVEKERAVIEDVDIPARKFFECLMHLSVVSHKPLGTPEIQVRESVFCCRIHEPFKQFLDVLEGLEYGTVPRYTRSNEVSVRSRRVEP